MWKSLSLNKLVKPRVYAPYTLIEAKPEELIPGVEFGVYKYNSRPRPFHKNHIAIFSCFSEFGSELIGSLYCLPRLLQTHYLGHYIIVMGWHGREFLYRHLVDEFWELDKDYHWLREYCRAFHHDSRNLRRLERAVSKNYGKVVTANAFTYVTLGELYQDIVETKKTVCWTPPPGPQAFEAVSKFLKPNSVGVTARARQCYGRNLPLDFYKRLLDLLQERGYDPIWMGEPNTTYDCPYSHVTNFRDSPEAADLEKSLALTSKLRFTIQFWTASTRLAGLVGTPFIIFESPDQIYAAHEGMRLNLCTKGDKKLVLSHFWNVYNDPAGALELVDRAIEEVRVGNYEDIVGLVESSDEVLIERARAAKKIGNL